MTSELGKMAAVQEKSQTVGEFLEWLRETKKYALCEWKSYTDMRHVDYDPDKPMEEYELPPAWHQARYSTEELLAEFFGINLKKAEAERREILEHIRKLNDPGVPCTEVWVCAEHGSNHLRCGTHKAVEHELQKNPTCSICGSELGYEETLP